MYIAETWMASLQNISTQFIFLLSPSYNSCFKVSSVESLTKRALHQRLYESSLLSHKFSYIDLFRIHEGILFSLLRISYIFWEPGLATWNFGNHRQTQLIAWVSYICSSVFVTYRVGNHCSKELVNCIQNMKLGITTLERRSVLACPYWNSKYKSTAVYILPLPVQFSLRSSGLK